MLLRGVVGRVFAEVFIGVGVLQILPGPRLLLALEPKQFRLELIEAGLAQLDGLRHVCLACQARPGLASDSDVRRQWLIEQLALARVDKELTKRLESAGVAASEPQLLLVS